ncbi:hypothetical protein HDK77DRAFT_451070 [Phyllosticta capitalensis]
MESFWLLTILTLQLQTFAISILVDHHQQIRRTSRSASTVLTTSRPAASYTRPQPYHYLAPFFVTSLYSYA